MCSNNGFYVSNVIPKENHDMSDTQTCLQITIHGGDIIECLIKVAPLLRDTRRISGEGEGWVTASD